MTIKEAQNTVDEWIKAYGVRYFSELTNMAVLTEEVGEFGADMKVELLNDGPVTICIDTKNKE